MLLIRGFNATLCTIHGGIENELHINGNLEVINNGESLKLYVDRNTLQEYYALAQILVKILC